MVVPGVWGVPVDREGRSSWGGSVHARDPGDGSGTLLRFPPQKSFGCARWTHATEVATEVEDVTVPRQGVDGYVGDPQVGQGDRW